MESIPDSRDFVAAKLTLTFYNVVTQDCKMSTVNDAFVAIRAKGGVVFMAGNITDCDIL